MKSLFIAIIIVLLVSGATCTAAPTGTPSDVGQLAEPIAGAPVDQHDDVVESGLPQLDPLWFVVAFLLGFGVRQVGLPPLLGFLAAGFLLNSLGVEGGMTLEFLADLGVNLLLFSIGLKLQLKNLLRPEVWGVASIHMAAISIGFAAIVFSLAWLGVSRFAELDPAQSLLVAFALSFSSTVFAVKTLEEKDEMSSRHGQTSIGILIVQDIFAIVFLTLSTGTVPSPWALLLLLLVPIIRPLLLRLMGRCGHGELLILFGVLLLFGSTSLFDLLDLKPGLGALLAGVLVGSHPRALELSNHLLRFKDLLLTAFFLNIGFSGAPSLQGLGIAAFLVALVPLKVVLFFGLLTRFRLRARTSLITSLSLANYSEFGLIVGAVSFNNGWINGDWLVIIAIALTMTFVLAAPLNAAAERIYHRWSDTIVRWQSSARVPGDHTVDPGAAEIVIFGMGRMGAAAYAAIHAEHGDVVMGIDCDADNVHAHQTAGRNVQIGDATDSDFWDRVMIKGEIHLIVLALSSHVENMRVVQQLRDIGFHGQIVATVEYDDEAEALRSVGVTEAYNIFSEAGTGFAKHVIASFPSPASSGRPK